MEVCQKPDFNHDVVCCTAHCTNSRLVCRVVHISGTSLDLCIAIPRNATDYQQTVFNPLKDIPGPLYSLFTTLPLKLAVLRGKRVHHIHALHLCYGPIVRISPSELSVADPAAFKTIHRAGLSTFAKSPWYIGQATDGIRAIFNMEDNSQHAARRKLLAPGFTKSSLTRDWESAILKESKRVVQRMREDVERTGEVDVHKWWIFFSADTNGQVMFGESFNMVERGERNQYIRDIEARLVTSGIGYELPILTLIGRLLPIPGLEKFFGYSGAFATYGQKAVKASKEADPSRRNVFATINAEAEKGEGLTDMDVAVEAGYLQVAGTDTTGVTLTYLTWAIAKTPRMMEMLVNELVPLPETELTDAHLSTLPYLNAVVAEALRLFHPVPSTLPRVAPQGGAVLLGHNVPPGTIVGTHTYTIHRLEECWGVDADDFKPERWVADSTMAIPDKARDAFVPWGGGAKACLGQHMAMMALRFAVTMFVREFGTTLRVSQKTSDQSMEMVNYFAIAPKAHACVLEARLKD